MSPGCGSRSYAPIWRRFTTRGAGPKDRWRHSRANSCKRADYETVPIDTDDFGSVLLRMGDRARGAFTVSQMSAGRKNMFTIDIYGTKAGVSWNQERPDELWIGQRNSPNQIIVKDPALLYPQAAAYRRSPGRPQRRLRRHAQAGVQALLCTRGGPGRAGGVSDI